MYKFPFIKKFKEKTQDFIISLIILPIGTLVSGTTFLLSALILVGLPGTFKSLFLVAVVPAVLINLVCGLFLIKVVSISVKRIGYKDLKSISK